MSSFISYLISGISLGSVYVILALGYTMVYGIAKMLNFAHGDVIMVGSYVVYVAVSGMGLNPIFAILLSIMSALGACGASGVAGGSLLLIPMACSLFGISNDIAMQVVAVGFIIGVLQDSAETALNSSTDVLFTAAACMAEDESLLEAAPLPSREA